MAIGPDNPRTDSAQAEKLYDQAWRLHRGLQMLLTVYPDLSSDPLYRIFCAEAYENFERAFLVWIEE